MPFASAETERRQAAPVKALKAVTAVKAVTTAAVVVRQPSLLQRLVGATSSGNSNGERLSSSNSARSEALVVAHPHAQSADGVAAHGDDASEGTSRRDA